MNLELKPGATKTMILRAIEDHNDGAASRLRLKASHVALLDKLVYYLSNHIRKIQVYGDMPQAGAPLPPLRTNRRQLARALQCCERTVYNLLKRVESAGLLKKRWHGSNSSFAIHFRLDLLMLKRAGDPRNLAGLFSCPVRQNLPHTLSGTLQDTSKLNKLSGVDSPVSGENPRKSSVSGVENPSGAVEKPVGEPTSGSCRDTTPDTGEQVTKSPGDPSRKRRVTPLKKSSAKKSAPPAELTPPATPPDTLEELEQALGGLSDYRRGRLRQEVAVMWREAAEQLYRDFSLVDTEVERARARLAEYLIYAHPDQWPRLRRVVVERIRMAADLIEFRRSRGKKAWVPIPSLYFDIRDTERNFAATKAPYIKRLRLKRKWKQDELVTKATNEYLRALNDAHRTESLQDTYRRLEQRLAKHGADVVRRWQERIVAAKAA